MDFFFLDKKKSMDFLFHTMLKSEKESKEKGEHEGWSNFIAFLSFQHTTPSCLVIQLQTIHGNHAWQVNDLTLLMLLFYVMSLCLKGNGSQKKKEKKTQSVLSFFKWLSSSLPAKKFHSPHHLSFTLIDCINLLEY